MSPGISTRLLATQSDERLLALVREGHERAFEALVHRYRKPLLNYCRRLPIPEARAEDVLQQALLKTWIALRGGAEVRDLKAWLYRVVHNTAVNAVRDAAHDRERLADPTLRPGAGQADLERGLVFREALAEVAALPHLQREVIVRTAVGGDSHEQVASDLGLTDGAVRGLLYRARATLRTAATALTPPPLLAWLAGRTDQGAPATERLGELAAGGGAAGLSGLIVKGGVAVVTAGTLLTGAVVHIQGSIHPHAPTKVAVTSHAGAGVAAEGSTAVSALSARSAVTATGKARPAGRGSVDVGARVHVLAGAPSDGRRPAHPGSSGGEVRGNSPATAPAAPSTTTPGSSNQGVGSTQTTDSSQSTSPAQGGGQAEAGAGQSGGSGASEGGSVGSAAGAGTGSEGAGAAGGAQTPSGEAGGSSPSGGAAGEGSDAQGETGTSESSGSGSTGSESSGGVVGVVVHEVGSLLEHVLH
jgi:RNA polymerase sigma factor (sigma-70 family)